jgi:hypothetical protein
MAGEIHKFIEPRDLAHYRSMTYEEIKKLITTGETEFGLGRETIGLPEGDIDSLLKEFRAPDFSVFTRKGGWIYGFVPVLNNNNEVQEFKTRHASFCYVNKWGQESNPWTYKIVLDNSDNVQWIGHWEGKPYFLSVDNKLYRIWYEHKQLSLFPNVCENTETVDKTDQEKYLDSLAATRRWGDWMTGGSSPESIKKAFEEQKNGIILSLVPYFEFGFFYRGYKWTPSWGKFLSPYDRTILTAITAENGLFRIEIENISYPHRGYLLFDLREFKIVESGKIG